MQEKSNQRPFDFEDIRKEIAKSGLNECIDQVYQVLADTDLEKRASEILGYALWSLELGISTTVTEAIANGKSENGID